MANEPLPVTQAPRALDTVISGGPTVADAVFTESGGTYSVEDSGTPAGYQALVSGNYEIDTGAAEHEGFIKIIDGVATSK